MNYPLKLSFKILGLAPQIYVNDAAGTAIFYVKQKLFKLKESVKVFRDSTQSEQLYAIAADRVIDFSARYSFTDTGGATLGAIKRQGMRSLFRASYEVFDDSEELVLTISEEAVWKRMIEALLGQIPFLGFFVILLINPSYLVKAPDGALLLKLHKKPAFFGGEFEIEKVADLPEPAERRALLAILMMTLLERRRG